ncbi:MAG: VWA domain-containing protein [Pseudomonadota bacterium]
MLSVAVVEPSVVDAPTQQSSFDWQHNGPLSVALSNLTIDGSSLRFDLHTVGGKPVDSEAVEKDHVIASNLSGLRLLVPGQEPLLPDFVPVGSVQSHLPIVALPERVASYSLRFTTPLVVDAPDIALVLPVAPPLSQLSEPFWIVSVRGELPSLASRQQPDTDGAQNILSAANTTSASDKQTIEPVKEVYAPKLPLPPAPFTVDDSYQSEAQARQQTLVDSTEVLTVDAGEKPESAVAHQPDQAITAGFDGKARTHYYVLPVDTSDQLHEIQLVSDASKPMRIELHHRDNSGRWQSISRRTSDVGFHQLNLSEPLLLSVTSAKRGSTYRLALFTANVRSKDGLYEPSDNATLSLLPTFQAHQAQETIEWHGLYDADKDIDFFRIDIQAPKLATLEVVPEGIITLYSDEGEIGRSHNHNGRSILADVLVPSGQSTFAVTRRRGKGIAPYAMKATLHPLPDPSHELEPNDTPPFAHRLTPGIARTGRLALNGDRDWYFFDWPGTGPARLSISGADNNEIKLELSDVTSQLTPSQVEKGVYQVDLHPRHYRLNVSSRQTSVTPYSILLSHAASPDDGTPSSIAAQLEDTQSSLAPYSAYPQSVSTRLSLTNNASTTQLVNLSARVTNDCCEVRLDRSTVNLAAGESTTVDAIVVARRDSASRAPFPVDIQVVSGQTKQWLRWAIQFNHSAEPHFYDWEDYPLPASMMGAWDVARTDFGAYPVDRVTCHCANPVSKTPLVAGSNPYTLKSNLCTAALHAGLIDSAGGVITAEVHPLQTRLHGSDSNGVKSRDKGVQNLTLLLSAGKNTAAQACPKRFELSNKSSADLLSGLATKKRFEGQELTIALAAPSAVRGFVLSTVGTGTNQAREIAISLSEDGQQFTEVTRATLPLYKGITPLPMEQSVTARYAKIQLLSGYGSSKDRFHLGSFKVLTDTDSNPVFPNGADLSQPHLGFERLENEAQLQTVAFHHKRLADITSVGLLNTREKLMTVTAAYSQHGPFGPWQPLGLVELQKGQPATLDTGLISARYLKFTSDSNLKKSLKIVSIIERPSDNTYRSILTEWGSEDSAARHEWFALAQPAKRSALTSSADNPITAHTGDSFTSEVSIRTNPTDFYRVTMPENQQALVLDFSGDPYLRTAITITDDAGNPVSGVSETSLARQSVRYQIPNTGSIKAVHVAVADTPRHLAVLWDDSGSVAPFISGIQKLIRNLAFELDGTWEKLHLTPLHLKRKEPFLTTQWTTDPYAIIGAIRRYRATGSSKSYVTIENALDLLRDVNGMRALLIMTDERGDRSSYTNYKLEKLLAEAGPTTFSFHVSSNDDLHSDHINRMQTWSSINGGRYTRLTTPDEIPKAFSQVQGWLRKPAVYSMKVSTIEAGAGQLAVRLADKDSTAPAQSMTAGAVEVIFDASGSMWKKLEDGSLRIAVAKQVLTDVVTDLLPDKTPFALRVFGHREPRSCNTRLEIPLAPLHRKKTLDVVLNINPQDRSRTPIAASLLAIQNDLSGYAGQQVVILITDGEETCDGDPQQAIEALKAAGVDVQINIVGFDIKNQDTQQKFKQWADLGGGDYFSADSAAQLRRSLNESLQPKYIIRDTSDTVVASGRVGDTTHTLPVGQYHVTIGDSESQQVFVQREELTTVVAK